MLDIKFVRNNPDVVKQNIKNKFQDEKLPLVDEVIELDKRNREIKQEVEALRAEKNKASKEIGAMMAQKKIEEAEVLKKKVAESNGRINELSEEEKRGRKHKNKVVLEAERQVKVALDKVEKYAVLATIDKKELTIPLLNIKAPVQEAMNAVNKELAIPIPTLIGQKTWQIDFIIFVTYP